MSEVVTGKRVVIYEAARRGDLERVRILHNRIMTISHALYTVRVGSSSST